jgi:hypothetical protein
MRWRLAPSAANFDLDFFRVEEHLVRFSAAFVFALGLIVASTSFAIEREPEDHPPVLQPATQYSGNTPIDLSNGILFNNGTFGRENPEYEAWAKSEMIVAGLSERPYSYAQKPGFITTMKDNIVWGESAIRNWKATTNEFPDALAYAKAAVEKMQPELDKFKAAVDKASGANQGSWASAEADARRALIDFRLAYTQMHKNVQTNHATK